MNEIKKIKLERGIPLYVCLDPSMKNTFFSYNVNYGSSGLWFDFNNNGKDYHVGSGYAHFLEHLLGEHSPYGNMYYNFKNRLQSTNAYTAKYFTSYHFSGKDDIEKSIEELIGSMEQPVFNQKDVDASRHAIEEESASYCDNTGRILTNLITQNLYDGFSAFDHTLSSIGNRETTKEITMDNLYNCYNAFYTDDRKYMIVAGNIDQDRMVDYLNEVLSKNPKHEPHLILPTIDLDGIRKKDDIIYRNIDEPIKGLGIKVKKPDSVPPKEFLYAMTIMEKNSYLSKEANELNRKGIIESCRSCWLEDVEEEYINYVITYTSNDKEASIQGILDMFDKNNFSKEKYELLKKAVIAEDVRTMNDKYGYIEVFPFNIKYTEAFSDIDFYQSISYEDFSSILESLDFSNYTVAEVKPAKTKQKIK